MTTASPTHPAHSRLAPARLRAAGAVAGLVLLVHALLLGLVTRAPGPGWRAQPPHTLHVRQIMLAAAPISTPIFTPSSTPISTPTSTPIVPPTAAAVAPAPPRRQAPATRSASADTVPAETPAGPSASPPDTAATVATTTPTVAVATPATTTTAAPAPATAEPAADPGGQTLPVYATQLPPPLTLQFDLRRGQAGGQAELDWRPLGDHYQLTLRSQAPGAALIGWASLGGFDSAGLAPLRYTESRRGREVRAANFQRDSGRITFSGPAVEYPLVAGAQDRLSWMVQLAAVLAANPALAVPAAQVSMWVVGTRGDAEVWTFTVQGRVTLDLPIGRVDDTLHLTRQPRRPYDTQVQVWLDPARHFVPVKVLLAVRASGDGTAFELRQVVAR